MLIEKFIIGIVTIKIKLRISEMKVYYIRVKKNISVQKVKDNFRKLECKTYSSVNGGVAWITKPELVKNYKENRLDKWSKI